MNIISRWITAIIVSFTPLRLFLNKLSDLTNEANYRTGDKNVMLSRLERNSNASKLVLEVSDLLKIDYYFSDLVRVGDETDGGYFLEKSFLSSKACISFGVGDNVSFERELGNHGIKTYLFDHTVPNLPGSIVNSHFYPLKIVPSNNKELNDHEITLENTLNLVPEEYKNGLILKCDIEGDEFEIFNSIEPALLEIFDHIVIEFHQLTSVFEENQSKLILETLKKFRFNHYLLNFNVNNNSRLRIIGNCPFPDVIEATFIKKSKADFIVNNNIIRGQIRTASNLPDIPPIIINFDQISK